MVSCKCKTPSPPPHAHMQLHQQQFTYHVSARQIHSPICSSLRSLGFSQSFIEKKKRCVTCVPLTTIWQSVIRFACFLIISISLCQKDPKLYKNVFFYLPPFLGCKSEQQFPLKWKKIFTVMLSRMPLWTKHDCVKESFAFYFPQFLLKVRSAWIGLCFVDSYWSLVKVAWRQKKNPSI